jgi:hypothetical protein
VQVITVQSFDDAGDTGECSRHSLFRSRLTYRCCEETTGPSPNISTAARRRSPGRSCPAPIAQLCCRHRQTHHISTSHGD